MALTEKQDVQSQAQMADMRKEMAKSAQKVRLFE